MRDTRKVGRQLANVLGEAGDEKMRGIWCGAPRARDRKCAGVAVGVAGYSSMVVHPLIYAAVARPKGRIAAVLRGDRVTSFAQTRPPQPALAPTPTLAPPQPPHP